MEGDNTMERLTYRDSTIWAHAERDCRIFEDNDEFDERCFSGELIDRLANYEDAEEQGLLIKLPPDGQIYHIEESKETGERWIGNKPCCYITSEGYHCGWGVFTICFKFDEIDKTVFLTREAAEASLKGKIENSKNDRCSDEDAKACDTCIIPESEHEKLTYTFYLQEGIYGIDELHKYLDESVNATGFEIVKSTLESPDEICEH